MDPQRACLLVAVAVSAVAAVQDWRTGRIANALTLGALAAAPLAHAWLAASRGPKAALVAAAWSIAGAVACGLVPLVLFLAKDEGSYGGDVKLLAAVGAILQPLVGIEAETYAFVAASLWAMGRMAYEGKLLRTLANALALVVNPLLPRARRRTVAPEMMTRMRFGPAVLAGVSAAAVVQWR